ncbi:MAG: exodeoxyribonuclease VII small subunit [Atopobiaceae bacterium]|nr:exodeoxyribonuclease VII small subunit [Atopobiaceae bacterium]
MARIDTSGYKTFEDITARLDAIVEKVRDKDTSLEHSLDLFDEAISLGSRAVEMVDRIDFSDAEKELLEADADHAEAAEEAAPEGDAVPSEE